MLIITYRPCLTILENTNYKLSQFCYFVFKVLFFSEVYPAFRWILASDIWLPIGRLTCFTRYHKPRNHPLIQRINSLVYLCFQYNIAHKCSHKYQLWITSRHGGTSLADKISPPAPLSFLFYIP